MVRTCATVVRMVSHIRASGECQGVGCYNTREDVRQVVKENFDNRNLLETLFKQYLVTVLI